MNNSKRTSTSPKKTQICPNTVLRRRSRSSIKTATRLPQKGGSETQTSAFSNRWMARLRKRVISSMTSSTTSPRFRTSSTSSSSPRKSPRMSTSPFLLCRNPRASCCSTTNCRSHTRSRSPRPTFSLCSSSSHCRSRSQTCRAAWLPPSSHRSSSRRTSSTTPRTWTRSPSTTSSPLHSPESKPSNSSSSVKTTGSSRSTYRSRTWSISTSRCSISWWTRTSFWPFCSSLRRCSRLLQTAWCQTTPHPCSRLKRKMLLTPSWCRVCRT